MKIKYLIYIALSVFLSSNLYSENKSESLVSMLPENCIMTIEVDDWKVLSKNLAASPWGEVAEFPVWEKISTVMEDEFFREIKNTKKFKEIRETLIDPMLESISGSMVIGVADMENLMVREMVEYNGGSSRWRAQKMPFFAAIFESSLSVEEFAEIISSLKRISKTEKNSIMTVSDEKIGKANVFWLLHRENEDLQKLNPKSTGICVSLHDGKFFLLTGDIESVEAVFDSQSNLVDSLIEQDSYIDCFDQIGRGNARTFINFQEVLLSLDKLNESQKMEIPQNPFGVTLKGLLKGMGLDGLEHLGLQINAEKKQFEVSSSVGLSHYNGLLSLFSPVGGNLDNHDFISSDVFTVSNARQDLGELWPRIESMLKEISPGLHLLVTSQIQAFEDQSEVAVRGDLLGSLGDEVVSLSYLNRNRRGNPMLESPSSSIYAISLSDSKLFERTIRGAIDSVSKGSEIFQEREHRGITIRSMRGLESAGISLSYAIVDNWFILSMGKPRHLNQLINKMESNDDDSLWKEPHMKYAMEDLPNDIRQLDYIDFREMFSFFQIMLSEIKDEDFNITADDFGEFPYFMLGWTKDTDQGIISKVKIHSF